jgi:hypothetical protein
MRKLPEHHAERGLLPRRPATFPLERGTSNIRLSPGKVSQINYLPGGRRPQVFREVGHPVGLIHALNTRPRRPRARPSRPMPIRRNSSADSGGQLFLGAIERRFTSCNGHAQLNGRGLQISRATEAADRRQSQPDRIPSKKHFWKLDCVGGNTGGVEPVRTGGDTEPVDSSARPPGVEPCFNLWRKASPELQALL